MKNTTRGIVLIGFLAGYILLLAEERPAMKPPRPVEGAVNHLDVAYLPQRKTERWEDRWLTMNIHVPEDGKGGLPCLVFVHGGGWGGGDKDGGLYNAGPPPRSEIERAVREGYVAVNLNYILSNGGSSLPQVIWDHRAAIRFLRANAARYRIDPERIGAWGISAGGWLASLASFTEPNDSYAQFATSNVKDLREMKKFKLALPYDDPRPVYGAFSSRLNCVVADFWKVPELLRPHGPALLTFVGEGTQHRDHAKVEAAGGRMTELILIGPKYAGSQSIHVPKPEAPARSLSGQGVSTLSDEAFKWLAGQLKNAPRVLAPEVRPNRRVFRDEAIVSVVASSPNCKVRYTVDGSAPTGSSSIYEKPFAIDVTTVVRAITERADGERSAPIGTTFTRQAAVPVITGPEGVMLPPAKVGTAYRQEFSGDGVGTWNLSGHLEIRKSRKGPSRLEVPAGLKLDPASGVLSGVPTKSGVFTFQVQAAAALGEQADARTYVLRIDPE